MANITRWDPLNEVTSLQDRINQLLTQSFPSFSGFGRSGEQPLTFSSFVPPVDVFEDEHNITVQAELPGIDEKDLDIRLENNVLTISGERKLENEEQKENFHRIERSYGRFTRSFTLPSTVDTEHVNAEFQNGVLKVTIAKLEEAKPKQIKIGVGKPTQAVKSGKEKGEKAA
ncbi:MAG TPA: Hsp20/alpha crystallin family protein [Candidatus Angelobacter sp.]|jgi:HSP20 family protein